MKHLNSNILCAVAVKTTGSDATKHEILEIAVIPVNAVCKVSKDHIPFNLMFKPERPQDAEYSINNDFMLDCCTRGMDPYEAAELFEIWFERLKLKGRKQIMVLSHNWASKREFLKAWLMPTAFNRIFNIDYRDIMPIGLYYNDLDDARNELCRFPKVKLSYMCAMHKVEYADRLPTVIDECAACIDLYRSLIYQP